MNVLGLIPARGGSKGVPRKNIRPLDGKPLLAWTIESAKASSVLSRVIVSTDDQEIADVAKAHGAETPFLRPADLSGDTIGDYPVFEHAVRWLQDHERYRVDVVVWLRPTTPFRDVADIRGALDLLQKTGADAVRSVCLSEHHPYWMKKLDGDRLTAFIDGADEAKYFRRQLLPPVYRLNGAVDVARVAPALKKGAPLFSGGDVRGYVMPLERSLDIDTPDDFAYATFLRGQRPA